MSYVPEPNRMAQHIEFICRCFIRGIRFHWTPDILMIELGGVSQVLSDLAEKFLVLGFDTFTLEGIAVHPRLDYYSDFGNGVRVEEALQELATWPTNLDLWVETVTRPVNPLNGEPAAVAT